MRRLGVIALVLWLVSAPAAAEDNPFALPAGAARQTADVITYGLVGANILGSTIQAFRAEDRSHALKCLGLVNGIAIGASEGFKAAVKRWRPDYSDQKSFPSEHSWLAGANAGWNLKVGWSFAIGTGIGRSMANRHHLSDVAAGLLGSYFAGKVCS